MKPIVLAKVAEEEMHTAAQYYEERQIGLGKSFLDEVLLTGRNITEHPEAWPVISGKIRRCLLRRFPFGMLFRVEAERVYVLAIMHLRRKPYYWRKRT